jgi:catechol 2,3-dioxygenase-like lactoylglutathione lyase family enzyme
MKKFFALILGVLFLSTSALAQSTAAVSNIKPKFKPLAFEHLRLNVADKDTIARWYVDHMGMDIVPSSNKEVVYVADKDRNFMIEFSSVRGKRMTYSDVHLDAFHAAFEGHKAIEEIGEKLLKNGAILEGKISKNANGDYVGNFRDPNGFTIQLIHRVSPFYTKPVKHTLRWEHVGLNVPSQMASALWYVEFMNMTIPWSKDMDAKANRLRNYRVPMVGDSTGKMSLEFYDKTTVDYSLAKMSHEEAHIAFTTDEPETVAKFMVYGGAKQLADLRTEANGDQIVDLMDRNDFPIRLIKRKTSVLNPK